MGDFVLDLAAQRLWYESDEIPRGTGVRRLALRCPGMGCEAVERAGLRCPSVSFWSKCGG